MYNKPEFTAQSSELVQLLPRMPIEAPGEILVQPSAGLVSNPIQRQCTRRRAHNRKVTYGGTTATTYTQLLMVFGMSVALTVE
jgi:hypothetical protein